MFFGLALVDIFVFNFISHYRIKIILQTYSKCWNKNEDYISIAQVVMQIIPVLFDAELKFRINTF